MKCSIDNRLKVVTLVVAFFFLFFAGMESLALARAGGGRSMGTSRGFSSGGSYQRSTPYGTQRSASPRPDDPGAFRGEEFYVRIGGRHGGRHAGQHAFPRSRVWRRRMGRRRLRHGRHGTDPHHPCCHLLCDEILQGAKGRRRHRRRGGHLREQLCGRRVRRPQTGPAYAPSPAQGDLIANGLRHISHMDPSFDEFRFKETAEDNFFKIQGAWTRRDLSGIRNMLTPQMFNTFQEDVNKYISNKQINRLENIAVRQVDIVDAVQDQGEDYITVKFLASLLDYVVDDTSNQLTSGSASDPVKFLEYWTFTRRIGERSWLLAGITQEGDY